MIYFVFFDSCQIIERLFHVWASFVYVVFILLKIKLSDDCVNATSIIAKLQLFSSLFEKLDSVTFSRWVNARTIPSIEKQLMVIKCFELDLYSHLSYISLPREPSHALKKTMTAFLILLRRHTTVYSKLNF